MKGLLLLLLLLAGPQAQAGPDDAKRVNVLMVGNSLVYVNNLPALFTALAAQQPGARHYGADLIAAPGGSIAERWQDGVAAAEIDKGQWQVLVLQERGGLLACLALAEHRGEPDCTASVAAHKKFAHLAQAHGMRVILLGTWGPDAIWQNQLGRGLRKLAESTGAEALDAGAPVREYAKAHPQTAMYSDQILHPTLDSSLLMAGELYRQIAGIAPQAVSLAIDAPLLPARARVDADRLLSAQPQLAGDGSVTRIEAERLRPLLEAAAASEGARHD